MSFVKRSLVTKPFDDLESGQDDKNITSAWERGWKQHKNEESDLPFQFLFHGCQHINKKRCNSSFLCLNLCLEVEI